MFHNSIKNDACVFSNNNIIEETVFFVTKKFEIGYKFAIEEKFKTQISVDFNGNKIPYVSRLNIFKYESVVFKDESSNDFITLFERDSKGNIISEIFDNYKINYAKVINENLSTVSYFYTMFVNSKNNQNIALDVINNLFIEIDSIFEFEINYVNLDIAIDIINENKNKLIKLLNDVDIKISDIKIEKNDRTSPIKFERTIKINDIEEKKLISFNDESKGTKKIFWMFVNLLNEYSKNHIFICDDMNAYLHSKLYKTIIELFNSPNNKCNQLIFNSHDIINMTNEIFRRDEIWLVYRDDSYSTKAIPLSNIVNYKGEQVRKDAKYYKQYLEGRYGADPFIKKGLEWDI